ncbi:predicted protein [Thalassiosira pseudonana CCMP1335]|jgi:hypothetical protein|uniref:Uncharacterized protein n=1 Tax=Thalassiosira pseudonana TaxID=35128 RepID=B8C0S9_THAPS|nr:predicted protein [Thalassiosira pseudonana CCMP1335]EED92656.1 predicted protein [Thalassiosira pseudonana CCMP1335]|eukprot:g12725.t1 g12725   contig6:2534143-2534601(-)
MWWMSLCSTLKWLWLWLLKYPDITIIAFKMKFYTALLLTALAGHSAKVYGSDAVDVSPDDVAITADSKGVLLAGYTNEGGDRGMTPATNLRGAAAAMFPLSVESDEEGDCSGLGGCRKLGCSCGSDHKDGKMCCWPFGGACTITSDGMRCES